jgi:hypothetical protein
MQELAQCLAFNAWRRDMRPNAVHGEHHERKDNPFSELGDIEYILNS